MPSPGLAGRAPLQVITATADPALLDTELKSIADIEKIEAVPLEQRLTIVDFVERIRLALKAREPNDTAISYIPNGDIDLFDICDRISRYRRQSSAAGHICR